MASKSTAKPSKKSPDETITHCAWCDKYGKMKACVCTVSVSYGRNTGTTGNRYFCNTNCLDAHSRQEDTIDINKDNELIRATIPELQDHYKKLLKNQKDDPVAMRVGESIFSEIKFLKATLDFNESLLRREKKDVLTMKRYKCLKIAGDFYESIQGISDSPAKHEYILNYISHYNDDCDENGDTMISGATAHVATFGT